jgi:hypothetical protein
MIGEFCCVKAAITLSKYFVEFNCFQVECLGCSFMFSGRCMDYTPIIKYIKPKGEKIDVDGRMADTIIDGFPYKFWFDDEFEKDGKFYLVPFEVFYAFDAVRDVNTLLENSLIEQASYTTDSKSADDLLGIAYPGTEIAGVLKRVYLSYGGKIERIAAINFEDAAQLQMLADNHADLHAVILTKNNVEVHLPLKLLKVYETPS